MNISLTTLLSLGLLLSILGCVPLPGNNVGTLPTTPEPTTDTAGGVDGGGPQDGPPPSYKLVVADNANNTLRIYGITEGTGALTLEGGAAFPVSGAYVLEATPDKKFLLAAGGDDIQTVTVDEEGDFSIVSTLTIPTAYISHLSVHPNGSFVYATDGRMNPGKIYVISLNPTTGALALVSTVTTGGQVNGMNWDIQWPHAIVLNPAGTFAYVTNYGTDGAGPGSGQSDKIAGYSVNSTTGALTPLPGSPFSAGLAHSKDPRHLLIDQTGAHMYVVDELSNPTRTSHFNINVTTGVPTIQGSQAPASGSIGAGIAISPDGKVVFSTNRDGNTVSSFLVNSGTGALTFVASHNTGGTWPVSLAMHPTGGKFFVGHQSSNHISIVAFASENGNMFSFTPVVTLPDANGRVHAMTVLRYPVSDGQ